MDWNLLWQIPFAGVAGILGFLGIGYLYLIEINASIEFLDLIEKENNVKGSIALIFAFVVFVSFLLLSRGFLYTTYNAILMWAPVYAAYMVHQKFLGTKALGRLAQRWLISVAPAIIASIAVLKIEEQVVGIWHVSSWLYGVFLAVGTLVGYLFCIFVKWSEKERDRSVSEFLDIVFYTFGGWAGLVYANATFFGRLIDIYALFTLGVQFLCSILAAAIVERLQRRSKPRTKPK